MLLILFNLYFSLQGSSHTLEYSYKKAISFEKRFKYQKSLKIYNQLCSNNYAKACYKLGIYYKKGIFVTVDHFKSVQNFSKGCQLKDGASCYNLTLNTGCGKNFLENYDYKANACQYGYLKACYGFKNLKYFDYLRKCTNNNARGCYQLANNNWKSFSKKKRNNLLKKSCNLKYHKACRQLQYYFKNQYYLQNSYIYENQRERNKYKYKLKGVQAELKKFQRYFYSKSINARKYHREDFNRVSKKARNIIKFYKKQLMVFTRYYEEEIRKQKKYKKQKLYYKGKKKNILAEILRKEQKKCKNNNYSACLYVASNNSNRLHQNVHYLKKACQGKIAKACDILAKNYLKYGLLPENINSAYKYAKLSQSIALSCNIGSVKIRRKSYALYARILKLLFKYYGFENNQVASSIYKKPYKEISKISENILSISVDQNQKQLAVGTSNGKIYIVSIPTGNIITTIALSSSPISVVKYSPASDVLVVGSYDSSIYILKMNPFSLLKKLRKHNKPITSLDISDDGERMLSIDFGGNSILWNLKRKRKIKTFPKLSYGNYKIKFAMNEKMILAYNHKYIYRYDLLKRSKRKYWKTIEYGNIGGVETAVNGHKIYFSKIRSGSPIFDNFVFKKHNDTLQTTDIANYSAKDNIYSKWNFSILKLSPYGKKLYGVVNNKIVVLDTITGKELYSFKAANYRISDIVVLNSGNKIITAGFDKTIRFWNIKSLIGNK